MPVDIFGSIVYADFTKQRGTHRRDRRGVGAKKASNKKTYSSFAELLRDPGVIRAGTHGDLFCD